MSDLYWSYGDDPDAVVFLAEFVVNGTEIGFGVTGGAWGAGDGVGDPQGNTVRERAEIWFDKI